MGGRLSMDLHDLFSFVFRPLFTWFLREHAPQKKSDALHFRFCYRWACLLLLGRVECKFPCLPARRRREGPCWSPQPPLRPSTCLPLTADSKAIFRSTASGGMHCSQHHTARSIASPYTAGFASRRTGRMGGF